MKVKLTYFKETGKYYSEGEYETLKEHMFEIFREVRGRKIQGCLPGLIQGTNEFIVLIEVPDHPHDHPHLIL